MSVYLFHVNTAELAQTLLMATNANALLAGVAMGTVNFKKMNAHQDLVKTVLPAPTLYLLTRVFARLVSHIACQESKTVLWISMSALPVLV